MGHATLGRLLHLFRTTPWARQQVDYELDKWAAVARMQQPMPAFGLPVSYARLAYGNILRLTLPAESLQIRLTDWVQCGPQVTHVAEHFVSGCDWTELSKPFAASGVMREARELLAAGLDFRRTRVYAGYRKRLESKSPLSRYKTILDSEVLLDAYFERFVSLFQSIQTHGVLTHHEAARLRSPLGKSSAVRNWRSAWHERDIGIAIGPDGCPVALPGGKHRLAIATVLGLSRVPVEVRMVHARWLAQLRLLGPGGWAKALADGVSALSKN